MAGPVALLMPVPGKDLSLVWPAEYAILLAWFALGAHLRDRPQRARRASPQGAVGRPVQGDRRCVQRVRNRRLRSDDVGSATRNLSSATLGRRGPAWPLHRSPRVRP